MKWLGKLWSRLTFRVKQTVSTQTAKELFEAGHLALVDKGRGISAGVTGELAGAAATLLQAVDGQDNVALRVGSLLVLKTTLTGNATTVVESLSPKLTMQFEKNPQLLQNPSATLRLLAESGVNVPRIDEGTEDTLEERQAE